MLPSFFRMIFKWKKFQTDFTEYIQIDSERMKRNIWHSKCVFIKIKVKIIATLSNFCLHSTHEKYCILKIEVSFLWKKYSKQHQITCTRIRYYHNPVVFADVVVGFVLEQCAYVDNTGFKHIVDFCQFPIKYTEFYKWRDMI